MLAAAHPALPLLARLGSPRCCRSNAVARGPFAAEERAAGRRRRPSTQGRPKRMDVGGEAMCVRHRR